MASRLEYGIPTDQSGLAVRFGIANGFFADAGIDLSMRTIYGGPELAEAIGSGEVPIGELGSPPGITAIGQGRRIRIVASAVERGFSFFLLVRRGIAQWSELEGATAGGLSRGSCGYWYLQQILSRHGLELGRNVAFRELGADYHRQIELLESGDIDLILSTEPYVTLAEQSGAARSLGNVGELGDLPPIQWMVVVANGDLLRDSPVLVRDILAAARRASRHAVAHLDEWIDFTAAHFGIDRATAAQTVHRDLAHHHFDGELDLPGLSRAVELQHRLGAIPRVLSLSEIADLRFQGIEEHGRKRVAQG